MDIISSRNTLSAAYVLLAGTSGYALKQAISSSSTYAMGTFGFLLGHSLLGFAHTTLEDPPVNVKIIAVHTTWLAQIVPLALINAEFYILTGFSPPYAYVHLASPIPPTAALYLKEEMFFNSIDAVVVANIISMGYLQFTKHTGVWTAGLIILHSLNHYTRELIARWFQLPLVEILTIGLSFFTVFAMQALREVCSSTKRT